MDLPEAMRKKLIERDMILRQKNFEGLSGAKQRELDVLQVECTQFVVDHYDLMSDPRMSQEVKYSHHFAMIFKAHTDSEDVCPTERMKDFYLDEMKRALYLDDLRKTAMKLKMWEIFKQMPNSEGSYQKLKILGFLNS